jgi:hypothetical protein
VINALLMLPLSLVQDSLAVALMNGRPSVRLYGVPGLIVPPRVVAVSKSEEEHYP